MIPVGSFLAQSWKNYQAKLWVLLLIGGLGGALCLASVAVPLVAVFFIAPYSMLAWILGSLIALCGFLWLVSWGQVAAMEAALAEGSPSLRECFGMAWPKIVPFSWICILWLIFSAGGAFLLGIPGIYVAVALSLAPFTCVAGGRGTFDVLLESMAYVRGHWWGLFGRLFLIGLLTSIPSLIPLVGPILGMIAAPFSLVAMALLFQDLKKASLPRETSVDFRSKILLAVCGCALLIPAALAYKSLPFWRGQTPQFQAQFQSWMLK